MASKKIEVLVPEEYNLERIDKFLSGSLEIDLSRSFIQKLIKQGNIEVNNSSIKQNYKVKTDDSIEITIPEPEELDVVPRDMALTKLYEDDAIIVINKEPGLVVHPGPGNWDYTLVNALLFHIKDLSSIGGVIRPGIVHRLDKDTTGIMVVAKNDIAHNNLTEQFSERNVKKIYDAIVVGKPKKEKERLDDPIRRHKKYRHKMTVAADGKEAVSEFELQKIWNTRQGIFSHLKVRIFTGRTHQIRVHLSSIGNPIVGDPIYSKKHEKYKVPYLLLASTYFGITHPITGEELEFSIDMPPHMVQFINKLDSIPL